LEGESKKKLRKNEKKMEKETSKKTHKKAKKEEKVKNIHLHIFSNKVSLLISKH